MKRLILSTIPDSFDIRNDIPIGIWCFSGKEEVYKGWENLEFIEDPYVKEKDITRASNLSVDITNSLIPGISKFLNEVNNTNYSFKFWKIITFAWMIYIIQTLMDHEERIKKVVKKYGGEELDIYLIPKECKWQFEDVSDFIDYGLMSPDFHWWIFSRVIEKYTQKFWKISYVDYKNIALYQSRKKILKKVSLFEKAYYVRNYLKLQGKIEKKVLNRLRCFGVFGFTKIDTLKMSLLLSLKKMDKKYSRREFENTDYQLKKNTFKVDIVKFLKMVMPYGFKNIENYKNFKIRPKQGKLRVIGPYIYSQDLNKSYVIAKYVECGEKIACTQHGGNLFRPLVFADFNELELKQNYFFSWGWRQHGKESAKIIPLPSPVYSKLKNKRRRKKKYMIFIGTLMRVYPIRLQTYLHGFQMIEYRENKIEFLNTLRKDIQKNTHYRPYPQNIIYYNQGFLNDEKYIKKYFPAIPICKGDLHKKILQSKIIIIDHPGTTMGLALSANIPFVAYWNPDYVVENKMATPYMKMLKNAEIVFENPIHAAEKINVIWDDIENWWNEKQIQEIRKKVAYELARSSLNWRKQWLTAIWKI